MSKLTGFKQAKEVADKAKELNKKFAEGKEKAIEQEKALQAELEALRAEERDIYSAFVLDMVEESAYIQGKEISEAKQKQLLAVQSKINDIDELKKHEMVKLFNDYKKNVYPTFMKEKSENNKQLKDKLAEAKQEFLQKITDYAKEQYAWYEVEKGIEQIEVIGEFKQRSYIEPLQPYHMNYMNPKGDKLNIGTNELYAVFQRRGRNK
ncbi:hypothetical protein [Oceanobacillus picturae]|uniref:hypothetical protein n=1 Tax=Oceanobacillus picturae TaxID=171693 RepID=UPI000E69ECFC|nr:hypothetical protein [Oceanobacillus picturae]RIU93303.1 hypothetical protein D1864_07470 [Oceanobacillus picturae]